MTLAKLLLTFFCSIQSLSAAEQQSSIATSPVTRALAIGTAEKEKPADQPSKILSAAEAQNMLEILEDPTRQQDLVSSLKKTVKSDEKDLVTLLSIKDFLLTAHTWFSPGNIISMVMTFIRIFIVLIIFMALWHGLNKAVDFYIKRIPSEGLSQKQSSALIQTIAPIARSTFHWILIALTILLILSEFNINIMPIIYSFSVITLAISLGSQTLVKDLINGAMTLFEGNMIVGDYVTINQFSGVVESISLRCVHLRHGTGALQTIPFSEVNHVINRSRDYSIADIQFTVAYEANQTETDAALKAVYNRLNKHPLLGAFIKSDLSIYGVSELSEWGFKVHAGVKTIPDPGKLFLNEFNRLLLEELQARKIPLPATVLLASDTINPKPFEV